MGGCRGGLCCDGVGEGSGAGGSSETICTVPRHHPRGLLRDGVDGMVGRGSPSGERSASHTSGVGGSAAPRRPGGSSLEGGPPARSPAARPPAPEHRNRSAAHARQLGRQRPVRAVLRRVPDTCALLLGGRGRERSAPPLSIMYPGIAVGDSDGVPPATPGPQDCFASPVEEPLTMTLEGKVAIVTGA